MSASDRNLDKLVRDGRALIPQHGRRSSMIRYTAGAGVKKPKQVFEAPAPFAAPPPADHPRKAILATIEAVKRDPELLQWKRDLALSRLRAELDALDNPSLTVERQVVTIAPKLVRQPNPFGRSKLRRIIGDLPPVFIGDIRPLAIGSWEQLFLLTQPGFILATRRWLVGYVRRPEYLAACAAPGSRRWNLDDSDAGEVSQSHREHAAKLLKAAP